MRPWILQTLKQEHCEQRGGNCSPEAGEQLDSVMYKTVNILLREPQLQKDWEPLDETLACARWHFKASLLLLKQHLEYLLPFTCNENLQSLFSAAFYLISRFFSHAKCIYNF